MRIAVSDAPNLKHAIESIGNIVEEGVFFINERGIELRAMDPSQISMISFKMPKDAFSEYVVDSEKKIGLDISQLINVLSRGRKGESAELSVDGGRFVIKFITNKKKRTFRIPILDIGEGVQKEPPLQFRNYVKINAESFKDIIKDAKLVSTHIKLILRENLFVAEVRGDSGDVIAELEKDNEEIAEIKVDVDEARATFPLQYLEDIMKASPSNEIVSIYLETNKPLKIEYNVIGANVTYYLAPRIETE